MQLEEMDFQDFEAVKITPQKSGLAKMLNSPIEPSFLDSSGRFGRLLGGPGRIWEVSQGSCGEKSSQNRCHFFRFVLISMLGYADRCVNFCELISTCPWGTVEQHSAN